MCKKIILIFIFIVYIFRINSTPLFIKPDESNKYFQEGIKYMEQKKYPLAIQSFKKSIKLDYSQAETHYFLGLTYLKINKKNDAELEFKSAISIKSDWDIPYNELISLLKKQKKFKEIIFYAKKILNFTNNPLKFKFLLAQTYTEMNDNKAALLEYYDILSRDNKNEKALLKILDIYSKENNKKMLKTIAKRIIKLDPGNIEASNILKNLSPKEKNIKKTIRETETPVNKKFPSDHRNNIFFYIIPIILVTIIFLIFYNKSSIFIIFLKNNTSPFLIKLWVLSGSYSENALHELEKHYIKKHAYRELVNIFNYLSEFISPNSSFLERFAYYCEQSKDYAMAEKVFLKMIDIEPNPLTKLRISNNFIRLKKYSKAFRYYDKFLDENPKKLDEIISFLKEQIKVNSRDVEIKELLADIYFKFKEYSSALIIYSDIAPLYKGTRVMEKAARCAHALKDWNRLEIYAKDLISLNPRIPEYHIMLADVYFHLGRINTCIDKMSFILTKFSAIIDDIMEKNREFSSNPDYLKKSIPILIKAIYTFQGSNRLKNALKLCDKILKLNPENTEALIIKAEIYSKNGDFEESMQIISNIDGYNRRLIDILTTIFESTHSRESLELICDKLYKAGEFKDAKTLYHSYYSSAEKNTEYYFKMSLFWQGLGNLRKQAYYLYSASKISHSKDFSNTLSNIAEKSNDPFIKYLSVKSGINESNPNALYESLLYMIMNFPRKELVVGLFEKVLESPINISNEFSNKILDYSESFKLNPILQTCAALIKKNYDLKGALAHINRASQVFPSSSIINIIRADIILLSGDLELSYGIYSSIKNSNTELVSSLRRCYYLKKIEECKSIINNSSLEKVKQNIMNYGKIEFNPSLSFYSSFNSLENAELLLCFSLEKLGRMEEIIEFLNNRSEKKLDKNELFIRLIHIKALRGINALDLAEKNLSKLKNDILKNSPWLKKFLA